jgi:hypothetical protein
VSKGGLFATEQLRSYQSKVVSLESLLAELASENAELASFQDSLLSRAENLTAELENAQARLALWETGAGLQDLSLEELQHLAQTAAENHARVQRAMFFAEFQQLALKNGTPLAPAEAMLGTIAESDSSAGEEAAEPAEPLVDPSVHAQVLAELEAARLQREELAERLEQAEREAEEREQRNKEQAETAEAKQAQGQFQLLQNEMRMR